MTTIADRLAPLEVTIETTRPRVTAPPAGRSFRDALAAGGQVLLGGVEAASALIPGGSVVSAAVRQGGSGASSGGARPEGPGGEQAAMQSLLSQSADQSMQFLQLQQHITAENRRYTALSNVMKARHDTAKASINNIR